MNSCTISVPLNTDTTPVPLYTCTISVPPYYSCTMYYAWTPVVLYYYGVIFLYTYTPVILLYACTTPVLLFPVPPVYPCTFPVRRYYSYTWTPYFSGTLVVPCTPIPLYNSCTSVLLLYILYVCTTPVPMHTRTIILSL